MSMDVFPVKLPNSNRTTIYLGAGGETVKVLSGDVHYIMPDLAEVQMRNVNAEEATGIQRAYEEKSVLVTFHLKIGWIGVGSIRIHDHGGVFFFDHVCHDLHNMFPKCRVSINGHIRLGKWNYTEYYRFDSKQQFLARIVGLPPDLNQETFRELVSERIRETNPRRFAPEDITFIGTLPHPKLDSMTPDLIINAFFDIIHEKELDVQCLNIEGTTVNDLVLEVTGKDTDIEMVSKLSHNSLVDNYTKHSFVKARVEHRRVIVAPIKDFDQLIHAMNHLFDEAQATLLVQNAVTLEVFAGRWPSGVHVSIYKLHRVLLQRGHKRLQLLPKNLGKSGTRGMFCGLCDNIQGLQVLSSCAHVICHDCIQTQFTVCIDDGRFPIACGECDEAFTLREVLEVLVNDRLRFTKMLERSYRHYVNSIPMPTKSCITPNCVGFFLNMSPRYQTCAECSSEQCVLCSLPSHGPIDCELYHERVSLRKEVEPWFADDRDNRKACPKCSAGIEKNGGCMHIQCSTCLSHFCWICLEMKATALSVHSHLAAHHIEELAMF